MRRAWGLKSTDLSPQTHSPSLRLTFSSLGRNLQPLFHTFILNVLFYFDILDTLPAHIDLAPFRSQALVGHFPNRQADDTVLVYTHSNAYLYAYSWEALVGDVGGVDDLDLWCVHFLPSIEDVLRPHKDDSAQGRG